MQKQKYKKKQPKAKKAGTTGKPMQKQESTNKEWKQLESKYIKVKFVFSSKEGALVSGMRPTRAKFSHLPHDFKF